MQYIALVLADHSGLRRLVMPGETVSLDHLSKTDRELLVKKGIYKPVKTETKEVKDNGTNDKRI